MIKSERNFRALTILLIATALFIWWMGRHMEFFVPPQD